MPNIIILKKYVSDALTFNAKVKSNLDLILYRYYWSDFEMDYSFDDCTGDSHDWSFFV